jgi:hypothetical protein
MILILSLIWISSFSQSKKKQIEHLKYQVDSIQEIFLKEKKESSKQILDLNESVTNLRSEITNLEINLENSKLDIDKNKITIIEQKRKIENLELTVQYLEDSLRNVQIKLQLQLLENSEKNLSDLELKDLTASKINGLYPNLINDTNSKSINTEKIKAQDSDQNNDQFCLERLLTSDIPENQSFRIFSTTDPRIEDGNPQFFWLYDDKTKLRALYFKCHGNLIKAIETKNKTRYNGVNGIGIETYDEKTNFENDRYSIEIYSSPDSASMIYWDSKIQIKSKQNEIIIIEGRYTGIEDSFD